MTLAGLMAHDVTIVHPATAAGRYGGNTLDWDAATRTTSKAWVGPPTVSEDVDGRDALIGTRPLYLPAGTAITGIDRVEWGDDVFEVDGPPYPAYSPPGEHHVEARLRAVTG